MTSASRFLIGLVTWRGLATRYDKHAIVYRGALVLAAVLLWRTDVGDTSLLMNVTLRLIT